MQKILFLMAALAIAGLMCPGVCADNPCDGKPYSAKLIPTDIVKSEGDRIVYLDFCGDPKIIYEVQIGDGYLNDVTEPEFIGLDQGMNYSTITPARWTVALVGPDNNSVRMAFRTNSTTTPGRYSFRILNRRTAGGLIFSSLPSINVSDFPLVTRTPNYQTYTPQPTPTPSVGSLIIESAPDDAEIYLDGTIKGITPLTLTGIPNGHHKILLRLDGYDDERETVEILGNSQTVTLELSPKVADRTTAPTETPDYSATLAALESNLTEQNATIAAHETMIGDLYSAVETQETAIERHLLATPTATVNYSATIAALENQIAAQEAKNAEQDSLIDQIWHFLFG
jgi:hypothetical protein